MSAVVKPMAPSSIALRTSARIRSSSSAVGDKRHALTNHPLRATVGDQRALGVVEHVDETRGDCEAGRIHLLPSRRARQIAAGRDTVSLNRDVLAPTGDARPVVDRAMPNDEVVLGASGTSAQNKE